ncbi:hypothetical protein [Arthrobacter psychrolactophilus]
MNPWILKKLFAFSAQFGRTGNYDPRNSKRHVTRRVRSLAKLRGSTSKPWTGFCSGYAVHAFTMSWTPYGARQYLGVHMELDWVDKSQKSGRQAIPIVLAVMVGFCGIGLPLTDAMYVPAFIAAIVFAVATPLTLLAVAPQGLFKMNSAFRWLSIAAIFSAACAIVTSGLLMSFGTPAGAAGDIGGFPMWLLSTLALVTVTSCAIRVWRVESSALPATLRSLQRQERRKRRTGRD